MNNDDRYYSISDIMTNAKGLISYMLKRWWLFLITALVGGLVGMIAYSIQKPKYEAESTFILEEKQSGMGGLSSIASQFGFDMGAIGGGGSLFAGDNILDILKSKKVVQKVLLTRIEENQPESFTLADTYLQFSKLKDRWRKEPHLEKINFSSSDTSLTSIQDSVLNIIYDLIIKKNLIAERASKKGTIIKVKVSSEDMFFSKLMAERLVDEASKMYLNIKTGTAQANIARMQRRSDSLLVLLNQKSYVAASSQLLDVNPGLKTAFVPVEISNRDKTVIATLYTEVTKNLEASKLMLSQQTPVIQLLDGPGMTLYDHKKSKLFFIIISAFITVLAVLVIVTIVYFMKPVNTRPLST